MQKMKALLKNIPILVKIYENIGMMRYFFIALRNAKIAKRAISEEEIEKIQKNKDIHHGERCFIVGSGPSLKLEDLDAIKNEQSFGVNSDYKIYSRTEWRPQYYVIMDDHAFDIFGEECYKENVYEAFFYSMFHKEEVPNGVRLVDNAAYHFLIDTVWNKLLPKIFPIAKFSDDISEVVYAGKTVVYAAIQIAAYMGFKEIYLLGVDCNYLQPQKHAEGMGYAHIYNSPINRLEAAGRIMHCQFAEMKKILPESVKVYNASKESMLDVFPKVTLEELKLK